MIRLAFFNWANENKRTNWRIGVLKNHVTLIQRRLLKRTVCSWRECTINLIARRQKSFLIMIINRWRIYTEDCAELRLNKRIALMHWASSMCAKGIVGLKLHAKNSKEKRLATSFKGGEFSHMMIEPSYSNRQGTKFTTSPMRYDKQHNYLSSQNHECLNPFKISYRSPNASMILNHTPDYGSRISSSNSSLSRNFMSPNKAECSDMHQNNRFWEGNGNFLKDRRGFPNSPNSGSEFLKNCNSEKRVLSSFGAFPRMSGAFQMPSSSMKKIYSPFFHDGSKSEYFMQNKIDRCEHETFNPTTSSVHESAFGDKGYSLLYSTGHPMTSARSRLNENKWYYESGLESSFSQAYQKTHLGTASPVGQNLCGPIEHKNETINGNDFVHNSRQLYKQDHINACPTQSVRIIKEVSTLLDDMVYRVECMNFGIGSTNRQYIWRC